MRGLDEETEEVIEDVEILSGKFAEATKTANNIGGISLFTDESKQTYKSTYQIIKELTTIWDDLSDKQHAQIEDIVGGKRQLQVVAAAISNFDAAEKAMDSMANSAGSAEAEMETIRDSAAFAMNELKASFESLAQNTVTRKFMKDALNFVTKLVEGLNRLVKTFGAIPTILGIVIGQIKAMNSIKNKGLFSFNSKNKLTFQGAGSLKEWFANFKNDYFGTFTGRTNEFKNNVSLLHQINGALATNADTTELCTNAEKSHSTALQDLAVKLKSGTATTKDCRAALAQMRAEANNSTIAIKALNTVVAIGKVAMSMFITTLVSMAIGKIIKAIDDSIHAAENLNKELKELSEKKLNINQELETLNSQLATTKEKIEALEKLQPLSLLQREELDELKKYNDELERQKKQRENESRKTEIAAHKKAKELAGNVFLHSAMGTSMPDDTNSMLTYEAYKKQIEDFKKLKEEIAEMNLEENKDDVAINKKERELEKLEEKILDVADKWENIKYNLKPTTDTEKKQLEYVNELLDLWETVQDKKIETLKQLIGDTENIGAAEYQQVVKQLVEMLKNGELTAEKFEELTENDIKGIDNFKAALKGLTDGTTVADLIEGLNNKLEKTEESGNNGAKGIKTFEEALEDLEEKIDDVISKQKKLSDTFKQISSGAKLSAEEVYELIKEIPDINKYIGYEDGGYTVSADGIKAINDKFVADTREDLQKKIDSAAQNLQDIKDLYEMAKKLSYESNPSEEDMKAYEELYKNTQKLRDAYGITSSDALEAGIGVSSGSNISKEFENAIEKMEEELNGYNTLSDVVGEVFDERRVALDGISEGFNNAKSQISDYNKEIQSIDSAIKALNNDTLLSYDELNELLEIDSSLQYENVGDRYSVPIEILEKLKQQSYDTRNSFIDDRIAEERSEIDAAQKSKAAILENMHYFEGRNEVLSEAEKAVLKALTGFETKEEAQSYIDSLSEQIDKWEENIEKLKGLSQEVTYKDDEKEDISKALQDQIDYYKTILDAVKIVREKYNDALENEKDGYEEIKDQMKEANDERQREIDLREAIINLENAKKRKVWVYSESKGFQQVQNKSAVTEAEEKVRTATTNIQEAEIDKKIKEIEDKQKQLEESTKDLENLEQNINDAKTVEQAKTALGLADEKDLLNLTDAVKQGITEGLTDAILKKEIEDNKDDDGNLNQYYTPVTLDDILGKIGAKVTAEDVKKATFDLPTLAGYNAAKSAADEFRKQTEDIIKGTSTYNNSNVFSPNVTVNGGTTEQNIADTVVKEMEKIFTQYCNTIK